MVSCSYSWLAPMECRSAPSNAGSLAANAGLRGPSVAVNSGRKSPRMQVRPVSNAGHYNYQVQLAPGSYVVELEYWSANELHAMAYSPALLPVEQLPMLKNGAYSSTIQTTSYHRVSFARETDLYFSGLGVNKTVYDTGMNLVKHLGESDQQVKLTAGQYVVKLHFWSSNTKSVNVTSAGLQ